MRILRSGALRARSADESNPGRGLPKKPSPARRDAPRDDASAPGATASLAALDVQVRLDVADALRVLGQGHGLGPLGIAAYRTGQIDDALTGVDVDLEAPHVRIDEQLALH